MAHKQREVTLMIYLYTKCDMSVSNG